MYKKLSCLFAVLCGSIPSVVNAATCPPIGTVSTLANPALTVILQSPAKAFDAYESTLNQLLSSAFGNIQNAVVDNNMQMAQTTLQSADLISRNQAEVQRVQSELKMNHEAYLERTSKREDAALLATGLGKSGEEINKDYFARLCAMQKTSAKAFSSDDRITSSEKLNAISGNFELSARGALLSFDGKKRVDVHYEQYCSETDLKQNLCTEVSKIPNADLLAFVFFNPVNEEGKGVIEDLVMKTEYTYSDYEAEAAKRYIGHIIPKTNLKKPSDSVASNPNTVHIKTRYDQLEAMTNLSRYVFTKAYSNRLPVVDSGNVRLSKYDQIRVLLKNAETKDLTSVTNANSKGKMVFIINQMNIENMLDEEISSLEKLNNDLLASIIAEKNGTPEMIRTLEGLK